MPYIRFLFFLQKHIYFTNQAILESHTRYFEVNVFSFLEFIHIYVIVLISVINASISLYLSAALTVLTDL